MKDIDYEAIHREAMANSIDNRPYGYDKAIIAAYERQKAQPEWVPLDLAKIKQGWELRIDTWAASVPKHVFIAAYEGDIIFVADYRLGREKLGGANWLMRAPKPKTVKVFVFKCGEGYGATTDGRALAGMVGEGDIEVSE